MRGRYRREPEAAMYALRESGEFLIPFDTPASARCPLEPLDVLQLVWNEEVRALTRKVILSGALNGMVVRTPAWAEALRQLRLAAASA